MSLEELLTMSTQELKRISIIEKVIDKKLTQLIAAQHLSNDKANKAFSKAL